MKEIRIVLFALTIALAMSSAPLPAKSIKIGEAELLYTEDEIPIRYDGSLSTIRDDGTMYFFHSFGCRLKNGPHRRSRHSWHYGPPLDPLQGTPLQQDRRCPLGLQRLLPEHEGGRHLDPGDVQERQR